MTSLARELARGDSAAGAGLSPGSAGSASASVAGAAALGAPASASACEALLACTRKRVAHAFARSHGRRQRLVSPARLGIDTANPSRRAERAPIKTISSAFAEPARALEGVPA
jgi:hypothetical protein